ncbi:sigma-70 family RNA polymerase sigma factor [uncultured Jannaschia sp.]|uniref:RNA polymerase sigma factor n=1 Tax=uncultured Jannaschia sp. TaxID=293347 RepID=UPI0026321329|nr:sigma-70 family RNA polymerase sigma factor [uncultured Jannaschia sp.]
MAEATETETRAQAALAALAAGETGALDDLMSLLGAPMTGFLARFLGSDDAARDCTQDVFLAIWRSAARYDPARGGALSWIYAIARNKGRDALRRRRLRQVIGLEPLGDVLASDAPGPERVAMARSDVDRTRAVIHDLPDRQRMALLMSVVAGLSTAEIGSAMGLSNGAVEQLLVRARRRLRDVLSGEGKRDDG